MLMESKSKQQQRHTMTSFSVTDILGNVESPRDQRSTPSDVTTWRQPEMTSRSPPPTHNAMSNKVRVGSGNLRWLQVLQQHPTRELSSHCWSRFTFSLRFVCAWLVIFSHFSARGDPNYWFHFQDV